MGDKNPAPPTSPPIKYGEDLLNQFGLANELAELRSRKLRSSFSHYISDLATDIIPLKPRCPAGSLAEIAHQPVNEDERRLELFDDRVLRNALTLKEGGEKPPMPDWLDVDQQWADDEKRKKRREKRKKKKKKKRKRTHDADDDDDDRRAKKKKR